MGRRLWVVGLCGAAVLFAQATWAGADQTGHGSTGKSKIDPALAGLLPPVVKKCFPLKPSLRARGLVGVTDAIYCAAPRLGPKSYVFAYLFDDSNDYSTSLSVYDKFKQIAPATPGVGCPTSAANQNGVSAWSNRTFPTRSGQVLECTTEADPTGKIDIPDYVWTVPTKNAILEVFGGPGLSMQRLESWWLANADTGALLR